MDDDRPVSGRLPDKMPRYIQTTQDMYLGGVPAGYIKTIRNRDFDSVFLTSLKGGSIRDLTFEDKYVYSFFFLTIFILCLSLMYRRAFENVSKRATYSVADLGNSLSRRLDCCSLCVSQCRLSIGRMKAQAVKRCP